MKGEVFLIKLCVFDMDGTIFDSLKDLATAMNHALAHNNLPTHSDLEKFKYFVGDGQLTYVKRAIGEPLNKDEKIVNSVQDSYAKYYNQHFAVYSKPYDGIIEMLEYLVNDGCKVAVFTNKPTSFAKQLTDLVFPTIKFEYVLGPSEEYPKKPDIKGLEMMLNTLNVKKEECLYFGDTNTDMITANKAGVISVGVTWGFRSKEELIENKAMYIIDHPSQAIELYNKYK